MATTDNGYSAPPAEGIRSIGVDGAFAAPGVKNWAPVYACFLYLMQEFDSRVEWLRPGWCWGYAYRENRNSPNSLSRHSGAIAVDLNAPLHPNGVPTSRVFTPAQVSAINRILDEIKCDCHGNRIFRWGGDYTGTPDAMHFEINQPPACVMSAAGNLNKEGFTMDTETKTELRELMTELLNPVKEAGVRQTTRIMDYERRNAKSNLLQVKLLRRLLANDKELDNETSKQLDDMQSQNEEILRRLDEQETQPDH